MMTDPRLRGRAVELKGRRGECDVLDRLIEAVRVGEGQALVVRGEPGVGKTALLGCCSTRPGASSRSIPAWPARRTWRRSGP
jgi:DNA helicase TIP49 (TBP-interacting protein)